MDTSVETVFKKLQESEEQQRAEEQRLQNLKKALADTEEEIDRVSRDTASVRASLNSKMLKLCEREVVLDSLKIREQVLRERNRQLDREGEVLRKQLREKRLELERLTGEFCRSAKEFCNQYGFAAAAKKESFDNGSDNDLRNGGKENVHPARDDVCETPSPTNTRVLSSSGSVFPSCSADEQMTGLDDFSNDDFFVTTFDLDV